jgi:transposase-like protein
MSEREQIERRQKDRRTGADRRQHSAWICDVCGNELVYLLPETLLSNECYECRSCKQKYVVLKYKGRRNQLARVKKV